MVDLRISNDLIEQVLDDVGQLPRTHVMKFWPLDYMIFQGFKLDTWNVHYMHILLSPNNLCQ